MLELPMTKIRLSAGESPMGNHVEIWPFLAGSFAKTVRRKMEGVRWARRILHREMSLDYTKWHATEDYSFTFCRIPIPLALEGTFLPETDDADRIDCLNCKGTRRYFAVTERDRIIKASMRRNHERAT